MRWLIDGYNVMHAGGRLGPKLGREGFRRARRRFLDDLAAALERGTIEQTTVVFDASLPPGDFALQSNYRGIRVVFALEEESADARIELLVAGDSSPKTLDDHFSDRRDSATPPRDGEARLWRPRNSGNISTGSPNDRLENNHRKPRRPRALLPIIRRGERPPKSPRSGWKRFTGVLDALRMFGKHFAPSSTLLTDAKIAEIQRVRSIARVVTKVSRVTRSRV